MQDSGKATVGGFDVIKEPEKLRVIILTGQFAAVDENLKGQEFLELVGRLYHLGKNTTQKRTRQLLEGFGLKEVAGRLVKTYSNLLKQVTYPLKRKRKPQLLNKPQNKFYGKDSIVQSVIFGSVQTGVGLAEIILVFVITILFGFAFS